MEFLEVCTSWIQQQLCSMWVQPTCGTMLVTVPLDRESVGHDQQVNKAMNISEVSKECTDIKQQWDRTIRDIGQGSASTVCCSREGTAAMAAKAVVVGVILPFPFFQRFAFEWFRGRRKQEKTSEVLEADE